MIMGSGLIVGHERDRIIRDGPYSRNEVIPVIDWSRNSRAAQNLLTLIGRTPTLELPNLSADFGVRLFAKLEFFSPSGSLKDRAYLHMIEEAENAGTLKQGMTILECSTGNAGIACALVAAVKGYDCMIVMPEGMSEERHKTIRAYGAELVFTPGGESDVDLALEKLEDMVRDEPGRYWVPRQFSNPKNIEAHYMSTAPEIWSQCGDQVDAFVATQGTGGTLTGIGRYFKERNPKVRIFAIEPAECPLLAHRRWGSHQIEGIGDGFVPENLDLSILDGVITVSSEEAIDMARRLAREEGIFTGMSSGANIVAARKLIDHDKSIRGIATMINDNGQRYFSTELFGAKREVEIPEREHQIDDYSLAQLEEYAVNWTIIE